MKLIISLLLIISVGQFAEEIANEILYEKAYYHEEIIGETKNIKQAIEIYNTILKDDSISQNFQAKVLMRLAICYKKLQQTEQVKLIYQKLLVEFPNSKESNFVSDELRKNQQTDSSKTQKNDISKEKEFYDKLFDEFYKICKESYEKGNLTQAQIFLKKALSFNPSRPEGLKLLEEIKTKLASQNTDFKEPTVVENVKQGRPWIISKNDKVKEVTYDVRFLLQEENWPNDYIFKRNFLSLLQGEIPLLPPFVINETYFANGNLIVSHSDFIHSEIDKLLQKLIKTERVLSISLTMVSGPTNFLYNQLVEAKLNFFAADSGVQCTYLPKNKVTDLIATCTKNSEFIVYPKSEITIIDAKIAKLEKIFDVPLVGGYSAEKIDFVRHEEGIRFIFNIDTANSEISVKLFNDKIQRPITKIPSPRGPIHSPLLVQQNTAFNCKVENKQSMAIIGLLDPLSPHNSRYSIRRRQNQNLIAFLSFEYHKVTDYFMRPVKEIVTTKKEENPRQLQTYSIASWQNIEDMNSTVWKEKQGLKSRNDFILRLCNDFIKNPDLFTAEIVGNRLIVYAPKSIHTQIQNLLAGLEKNKNNLQFFSIHLFSLSLEAFQKLSKTWQASSEDQSLQVYTIKVPAKDTFLENLEKFEGVKLETVLSPVIAGNTQRIEINDLKLITFLKGINVDNPFQAAVKHIPHGVSVKLRPIIMSENESFLEISGEFHQIRGMRNVIYEIKDAYSFSLNTPEIKIQRGFAQVTHKSGNLYILSGFKNYQQNPPKEMIFVVVPSILGQKETKEN